MPNYNELLNEVKEAGSTHDIIRRKYLSKLSEITGRNTILYYSAWLQKDTLRQHVGQHFSVNDNDNDKNGFMAAVHKMDRTKGLDIVLHTPGGDGAATESLVDYLRSMFGTNIRAIVPQLAMSAGTMIACACKEILMGKHSSLGPIDPQIMGLPAHGIMEEVENAKNAIKTAPNTFPLYQVMLSKYPPTLIGECEKAIKWSEEMVKEWLKTGMFSGDADKDAKATKVHAELGDHALTKSHGRHISMAKAREIGLNVVALEDNPDVQDAVLTVHHAAMMTMGDTPAVKLIENHMGIAIVLSIGPNAGK
jgi:ClpP class serine protease